MDRTNEQWANEISAKVAEVLGSNVAEVTSYTTINSPDDPAFVASIDHTLLKPDATVNQIDSLCDEALQYGFKSCCVNSANIKQVTERLKSSNSIPCAVIGFPLGATTTAVKAFEAHEAVSLGACEIDMVISAGHLKSHAYTYLFNDISSVVVASTPALVKVIIETILLTDEEKIAACFIAAEAGAAFVKTCTGFVGGGAEAHDVRIMKRTVAYKGDGTVKVKASAGIRSWERCVEMLKAGADRIGTSSGAAIMQNANVAHGTY